MKTNMTILYYKVVRWEMVLKPIFGHAYILYHQQSDVDLYKKKKI